MSIFNCRQNSLEQGRQSLLQRPCVSRPTVNCRVKCSAVLIGHRIANMHWSTIVMQVHMCLVTLPVCVLPKWWQKRIERLQLQSLYWTLVYLFVPMIFSAIISFPFCSVVIVFSLFVGMICDLYLRWVYPNKISSGPLAAPSSWKENSLNLQIARGMEIHMSQKDVGSPLMIFSKNPVNQAPWG